MECVHPEIQALLGVHSTPPNTCDSDVTSQMCAHLRMKWKVGLTTSVGDGFLSASLRHSGRQHRTDRRRLGRLGLDRRVFATVWVRLSILCNAELKSVGHSEKSEPEARKLCSTRAVRMLTGVPSSVLGP